MITLEAYLSENRIKQADFAATVSASQATISKLINRTVMPGLSLALRIEKATDGRVPASIWVKPDATPVSQPPHEDAA